MLPQSLSTHLQGEGLEAEKEREEEEEEEEVRGWDKKVEVLGRRRGKKVRAHILYPLPIQRRWLETKQKGFFFLSKSQWSFISNALKKIFF